jgi:hypothetical protein
MWKLIFLSMYSTLVKSIYYTEPKANGYAIQIIFHILSQIILYEKLSSTLSFKTFTSMLNRRK